MSNKEAAMCTFLLATSFDVGKKTLSVLNRFGFFTVVFPFYISHYKLYQGSVKD